NREAELLRSAYLSSLALAKGKGIASISFPSLSTGAYGYPVKEAAQIALQAVLDFMTENLNGPVRDIVFVLFALQDLRVYQETLQEVLRTRGIEP
ncbi:MAG: macro domain-containing protein, partial [Atribacterota bacterium]